MSVHQVTPVVDVFAVRIPSVIYEVGKSHNLPLDTYSSLPELSQYVSIQDIFFFIRSQHDSVDFITFKDKTKLMGLLNIPENRMWFESVKAEYDKYIQRIEDENTIRGVVPPTPIQYPIYVKHKLINRQSNLTKRTVYLREVGSEDDYNNLDWINQNREFEVDFKFTLLSQLYDFMGFDVMLHHPSMQFILSSGK